jgi:hypothetical protein
MPVHANQNDLEEEEGNCVNCRGLSIDCLDCSSGLGDDPDKEIDPDFDVYEEPTSLDSRDCPHVGCHDCLNCHQSYGL